MNTLLNILTKVRSSWLIVVSCRLRKWWLPVWTREFTFGYSGFFLHHWIFRAYTRASDIYQNKSWNLFIILWMNKVQFQFHISLKHCFVKIRRCRAFSNNFAYTRVWTKSNFYCHKLQVPSCLNMIFESEIHCTDFIMVSVITDLLKIRETLCITLVVILKRDKFKQNVMVLSVKRVHI